MGVKVDLKVKACETVGFGVSIICGCDEQGIYTQQLFEFEGIKLEFSATLNVVMERGIGLDKEMEPDGTVNFKFEFGENVWTTDRQYLNISDERNN